MKKQILIGISLLTSSIYAQKCDKENYFSVSVAGDMKNAVLGSEPIGNKPSLNLSIKLHATGNNHELAPEVEIFPAINFIKMGCSYGYHLNYWYIPNRSKEMNLTLVPSIGLMMINRNHGYNKEVNGQYLYGKSSHFALQGALSLRLNITDKILLDYTLQALSRPDLGYFYPTDNPKTFVFSNFFGAHYILN